MGRLECGDAHAAISFTHEQLHTLLGAVAQLPQCPVRSAGQGERLCCSSSECDETGAEGESPLLVTSHQAMCLQRGGQPVGGGPGQPGGFDELRERTRRDLEGIEHHDGLVQHADTAYSVSHKARLASHYVRR